MKRFVLGILIVLAISLTAGCGGGGPDALYSWTTAWGASSTSDPVGKRISMTAIALCTKGHSPVTITSIEPVTVTGQMHVDELLVSRGVPGELEFDSGAPPGSRLAAGFTIPAPTKPCMVPGTSIPRYQAIVLAHRTGARYGSMIDLRVHYRIGTAQGVCTIHVTYTLCGKDAPKAECPKR